MAQPTLLTYGPGAVDETLTLAWSHMIPGIKDNVFNENTALGWFYKTGKESIKGGSSISHGLMYGGNNGAAAYSRYEQFTETPVDGLTRDQWTWKQYKVPVHIDGFTERTAGGGDSELADALQTKKMQSQGAIKDLLERDIFAASPGASSLRSLPVIVLNSGTEGQVNGTTNSWFQAIVNTAGSWAAGVGRTQLTATINLSSKRSPIGMPDLLLSDQTSIEAYEGTLVPQYRFVSEKGPDSGPNTSTLTFKGIKWLWSIQANSGVIYVLNSEAIKFYVDKSTDFITTPFIMPTNQDAKVSHIFFTACLATCARRSLGKTTANAA